MHRRAAGCECAKATGDGSCAVRRLEKREMMRVIHEEHDSPTLVAHMLKRNVGLEEDLVDQLFNSSEKRLARALLIIARYGKEEKSRKLCLFARDAGRR